MEATVADLDALIRRTATVTAPVRKALVEEEVRRRANRQEDHNQAGMMGEPIPNGQSREELQRWADAVKAGKYPFVHIPANIFFKPAGVEDLTRTTVKGAGPFSGTYYHVEEIEASEIRKAVRDKTAPQGALDALEKEWKANRREPQKPEIHFGNPAPAQKVSTAEPETKTPEPGNYEDAMASYKQAREAALARGVNPQDKEA